MLRPKSKRMRIFVGSDRERYRIRGPNESLKSWTRTESSKTFIRLVNNTFDITVSMFISYKMFLGMIKLIENEPSTLDYNVLGSNG